MDEQKLIELTEKNIRQALDDYGRHTTKTDVLDDVSDAFISQLAQDSVRAKAGLRELFRKSPVWNEELQALVINGTRTHNPDRSVITSLAHRILWPAPGSETLSYDDVDEIADFFASEISNVPVEDLSESDREIIEIERKRRMGIIKRIAPKAYVPGKKLSRVFKAVCDALHLSDETAGSRFQRLYAKFADELTAKKIDFKLYVSINPAHFLTMSNPKGDDRGPTLTSCHSFNSTEYSYNCGCTGYARDENTFIVFTAADPNDPETLNNRKTTRQIFAYKPGNGLLLQSRLYNTSGGTHGAQEESMVYRDLVQREISALEDVPNLWKTAPYLNGKEDCVNIGGGFGGYADWEYPDFEGKVSIRRDHKDDYKPLTVGTYGLCVMCGGITDSGLYCDSCCGQTVCDECGERFDEDDLTWAYDGHGNEIRVCEDCLDEYYRRCEHCDEYYPVSNVTYVGDVCVCEDCLDRHYISCDECGEYVENEESYSAVDENGNEIEICCDCRDEYYHNECENCERYIRDGDEASVLDDNGRELCYCPSCVNSWCDECDDCGSLFLNWILRNGQCPECAAKADDETEEAVV